MKTQPTLNAEQEQIRMAGLRALARLIARHALAEAARDPNSEEKERPADGAIRG